MPVFGGAPQCQRCNKSVYMAEQVIGPGGAYHRSCLTCKECNKRLDSTTLTERDNEAYCKVCYNRKWGPKGYGFASGAAFLSTESKMPKDILEEQQGQHAPSSPSSFANSTTPQLPPRKPSPSIQQQQQREPESPPVVPATSFWSSRQGVPGTKPPVPTKPLVPSSTKPTVMSMRLSPSPPSSSASPAPALPNRPPQTPPRPQQPSVATKPAYLNTSYTPKKVNINIQNDTCTKCGKSVYAAELAMGAGNKYHKFCLKCTECGKLLSSTNMVDKDFDLYCRGCYAKLHGPKGFGYGNLLSTEGSTR
ncbi:hypothetical protein BDA99DRAFT_514184 [Phascolomyces articulosus]|uniref:LIM zinc-binding domain-containing protein n=1 Tax=Phascolomyces articulosus TaxID=60185 RepID=A0AAD5K789_9FUNG|nr:hypothetical protein BDA99DRAFT_514184 [Phascolomyces articulosus]